ncbi:YjcZ family sporulation protein [Sporolactobacillus sp. THM7-7]|nr:YjcZ family sporulation protein [Sporolactobacillus sp. THM7-7]
MSYYGGYGGYGGYGHGKDFALIVVLFILLIIVGATFVY